MYKIIIQIIIHHLVIGHSEVKIQALMGIIYIISVILLGIISKSTYCFIVNMKQAFNTLWL
jgi:hypothetical protein